MDTVEFTVQPSKYAPSKTLLIRVNNQEIVRQFLNGETALILEEFIALISKGTCLSDGAIDVHLGYSDTLLGSMGKGG